jgi:hypothetical protein
VTDPAPTTTELGLVVARPLGSKKAWRAEHSLDCWQHHTECALRLAQVLMTARRDDADARARRFGDALRRSPLMDRETRHRLLGEVIVDARALLHEERTEGARKANARESGKHGGRSTQARKRAAGRENGAA